MPVSEGSTKSAMSDRKVWGEADVPQSEDGGWFLSLHGMKIGEEVDHQV